MTALKALDHLSMRPSLRRMKRPISVMTAMWPNASPQASRAVPSYEIEYKPDPERPNEAALVT
jgi:hypothetical protein